MRFRACLTMLVGASVWLACAPTPTPSGSTVSAPTATDLRWVDADPEDADRAWEFALVGQPSGHDPARFWIGVQGIPGRLVGLSENAQRAVEQEAEMGGLLLGGGRRVRIELDLVQRAEGLSCELRSEIRRDDGTASSSHGVSWYVDPAVARPLQAVHWVGPVGGFDVPAAGLDLLELSDTATLRIRPLDPPAEGSH